MDEFIGTFFCKNLLLISKAEVLSNFWPRGTKSMVTVVFSGSWRLLPAPIIRTWLCFRNVPAATSISNSSILGNNWYGATPRSSWICIGYTQPQGEPIGVDVSGAEQVVPLQSVKIQAWTSLIIVIFFCTRQENLQSLVDKWESNRPCLSDDAEEGGGEAWCLFLWCLCTGGAIMGPEYQKEQWFVWRMLNRTSS